MIRGVTALVIALSVAAGIRGAAAQDAPAFREAVRLAAEGRSTEARRIVDAELARARPGDPAYVEALFARARVTTFGDSAERDLRRIAIEFPQSPWADDALLALTQLAMAAGNPVSAFALAQRLRSDYPGSDLKARAAFWAGRAAFDIGDPRAACALLDSARTESSGDVEFGNQIAFYRARCSSATAPSAPTPRSDSVPPRARPPVPDTAPRTPAQSAPAPAARTSPWSVQAAAVRTDAEERRVLEALRRGGLETRVARGEDGYRRIRVGGYATEREAQQALVRVRRLVGGRPFVVRER